MRAQRIEVVRIANKRSWATECKETSHKGGKQPLELVKPPPTLEQKQQGCKTKILNMLPYTHAHTHIHTLPVSSCQSRTRHFPTWRIGKISSDMKGTGEIKYPGRTKTS